MKKAAKKALRVVGTGAVLVLIPIALGLMLLVASAIAGEDEEDN